jgi:hypothetical protein
MNFEALFSKKWRAFNLELNTSTLYLCKSKNVATSK